MKNLIFISLMFLACACHKKKDIHISAINPVNGQPWPGLHYTITKQKSGAFEEKYKKVGEGYLDANGKAVHNLRLGNASYEINIEDPGNVCYVNNTSYTFESNSNNFDFVFKLATCCNLKLKIQNVNCQSANDVMVFQSKNNYNDWNGFSSERFGCYSAESEYIRFPAGWIYYNWKVERSGVITETIDSIYIGTEQYGTFNLEY